MTSPALPDRAFDAFLFDMDGTILTSLAAAERVWTAWATRHGVEVASFLPTIHGKRAIDTISGLQLPGVDAEAEALALTLAEIEDVEGIQAIAGAAAFLASLPPERWAVVTSAPRTLALRRIEAAGLPVPPVLITADDVTRGKPAPDGFQLAASRLGTQASNCLVFEDAIAGIQSAEAAGASVVVVDASHLPSPQTSHPRIAGYGQLVVAVVTEGLRCMQAALPGAAPSTQGR
jgi:mannitol-1-/sugar-/sorbitol-6-phosphatase